MTRRWLASTAITALGALAGSACSGAPTLGVTELNLDRPVDVSFACYGQMRQTDGRTTASPDDPIVTSAMPTAVCQALSPQQTPIDKSGNALPVAPFPGQEHITTSDPNVQNTNCAQSPCWYGFFLQSASGTVALAQWPSVPADATFPSGQLPQQVSDTVTSLFSVLDADPLTPGKNALSIGEDPVALGTDKTGCFEITANAGSCDLSELNITSALRNIVDGDPQRPQIERVSVIVPDDTTNQDGTPGGRALLSKPSAMIVQPFRTDLDTAGNACPDAGISKLYVAYPSCNLVAEVQLGQVGTGKDHKAFAKVIGGIQFDASGTPSVLAPGSQALKNLSCPAECPGPGMPVASAPDGLRPVALDYRLDPRIDTVGLTKTKITSRLAIGADIRRAMPLAAPVTVLDLDLMTFDPVPGSLLTIPLEAGSDGPVSVSQLALSPQIGMGGDVSKMPTDDNVNDQAQYVYAVASDGTVRVADVLSLKRECDTQIDGRFLRNLAPTPLECLPMGRPDLPRRPGARSPGIELPGDAIPSSVAIIKGPSPVPQYNISTNASSPQLVPMPAQPTLLIGHFAVITASSGAVYVANVDDDYVPDNTSPIQGQALRTSPVLVMAHQLRENMSRREAGVSDCESVDPPAIVNSLDPTMSDSGGALEGGPRLSAVPVQQFTASTLFDDLDNQLPRLQQVVCDLDQTNDPMHQRPLVPVTALEFGAPEVQAGSMFGPAAARDTVYPDLRTVSVNINPLSSSSLENWTLTYEGTLELDSTAPSTNGPSIHSGQAFVDRTGMFIQDASQPFCHLGVEPFDVVEFQGCDPSHGDADCPAGYTCFVHPSSTINVGACFLKTEAPRLQDACRDFLSSVRRYTVGTDPNGGTSSGKLVLLDRKHELSTTPVDGCVSDDQCDDLARAALVINQSADPFVESAAGTPVKQRPTHWSCMADPQRKAINTDPARNKRCVQVCDPAPADPNQPHPVCASGMVCTPDPTSVAGGVCMEGVEPPQVCLNGPQRYVVRAGEAFTVIGDQTGFVHPIIVSPTDGKSCVRDPQLDKDPLSLGRIPLTAPPCNPNADPFTGLIGTTGQFEANPCSETVNQFEYTLSYAPCFDGAPPVCAGNQAPPCPDGQAPLCSNGQPPSGYGTCRNPSRPAQPATRMNVPAIKFRNRALTLTVVDPYRSSADACIGRNPGNVPTNIPLVVPGYQIAFGVKAGFSPLTLTLLGQQVSPVKVVRGPSESIWVVDDGDFIGDGITQATTQGRVFRIESVPAPATSSTSVSSSATLIVNTMQ